MCRGFPSAGEAAVWREPRFARIFPPDGLFSRHCRNIVGWGTCMLAKRVVGCVQLPAGSVLSAQGSLFGATLAISGSILASQSLRRRLQPVLRSRQLVPADYDLVEPIRMVTTERGKPVMVVCPGRWAMAAKLRTVASHVRHIHSAMLRAAQFPPLIPGTTISKPQGW